MKKRFLLPAAFMVVLLIVSLASCKNEHQKMGLAKVDSLMLQMDTIEAKLAQVNIDTITYKFNQFKEYNDLLIENFDDIRTEENFQMICLYRYVKKSFELMIKESSNFRIEIDTARIQINNLKEDISNDLLTADEIRSYCELERINVKALREKITFRVDNAIKEEVNFDTIHPRIVGYVNAAIEKKGKK